MQTGDELYSTDDFKVVIVELFDPALKRDVKMYGIINKRTNVIEAEVRRYSIARKGADVFTQELLDIENPKTELPNLDVELNGGEVS